MKITFKYDIPVKETMVFEKLFEGELALDYTDKKDLLKYAIGVWMFVDGRIAGEAFAVPTMKLEEDVHDTDSFKKRDTVYIYSTTILPKFQGRGLAKILKAHHLGVIKGAGFKAVIGHSTSPEMFHINELFGAKHTKKHQNWYGTNREAHFYILFL